MKTKHIIFSALALTALTACEDYTEHNFGSREDLYQATQVSAYTIELTDANYADIANNADNIALAQSANDEGKTYEDLLSVANKKYLRGNITAEEYVLPLLKNLVGSSKYYAMTSGSSIKVIYRIAADSIGAEPAIVAATGISAGQFYANPADELKGTDGSIDVDTDLSAIAYTFSKEDTHYLIANGEGEYLYTEDGDLLHTNDLGDLDEAEQAQWEVKKNSDGTFNIKNLYDGTLLLGGQTVLYKEGTRDIIVDATPEVQEAIFQLDEDGWAAKADYLNQTLLGVASVDMDAVYSLSGWSVEYAGSIGELTYVWKLDATYGLRASAYKSSTYYPTDAWAISPKMNMKKAKQPVLTFQEAQKYAGTPLEDFLQVWVSTNYEGRGQMASAQWTNVTDQLVGERPDGSSWDYKDITLDMSAYAGQPNVVVAFRYISTESVAATWEVKNIICKEAE